MITAISTVMAQNVLIRHFEKEEVRDMNGLYFIGAKRNNTLTIYSKKDCGWVFKHIGNLGTEEEFTLMDKTTALSTIQSIKEIVGDRMELSLIPYENGRQMGIC